jgi:hypothetical protein
VEIAWWISPDHLRGLGGDHSMAARRRAVRLYIVLGLGVS